MRDGHRAEAERLLARAVEEEVRRSGGRSDRQVLMTRARGALDAMAQTAAEEYEAYARALEETESHQVSFGQRYAREGGRTPCWWRVLPPSRRRSPISRWAPVRARRSAPGWPSASSGPRRPW